MSSPTNDSSKVITQDEIQEKNGFVTFEGEQKTGRIMRSLTAPLDMLDSDYDEEETQPSTKVSSSANQSDAGSPVPVPTPPGLTQRRRSVVTPFGPFEHGEVITEGIESLQEKMQEFQSDVKKLGRRNSIVETFFSPKSGEAQKQPEYKTQNERKMAGRVDPRYQHERKYDGCPESLCTCLMVRNIPNKYTQRMLVNELKKAGFDATFDFLYVPVDFNSRLNVGYFFINFEEPQWAHAFTRRFHGYKLPAFNCNKALNIGIANLQGLDANIKKLQDSSLMTDNIPPEYVPLIFDCSGDVSVERPFPTPIAESVGAVASRKQDPTAWAMEELEYPANFEGGLYPKSVQKSFNRSQTNASQRNRPKHHAQNDFTLTDRQPSINRQRSGRDTAPGTPDRQQSYNGFRQDSYGWGGNATPPPYSSHTSFHFGGAGAGDRSPPPPPVQGRFPGSFNRQTSYSSRQNSTYVPPRRQESGFASRQTSNSSRPDYKSLKTQGSTLSVANMVSFDALAKSAQMKRQGTHEEGHC